MENVCLACIKLQSDWNYIIWVKLRSNILKKKDMRSQITTLVFGCHILVKGKWQIYLFPCVFQFISKTLDN